MAKSVVYLLLVMMLASGVMAVPLLGTFQTGTNVTLIQSCDSSSYSNISKITYPNSSLALNTETAMTVDGGDTYSYIFSNTELLGRYLVYGHCDEGGVVTNWVYDFEVTYTGQKVSLSNSMIIFALLGLAAIFLVISFFFKEDYWMLKSLFQFLAVLAGLVSMN